MRQLTFKRLSSFTVTTIAIGVLSMLSLQTVHAYPMDGYEDTGIRRTEGARLADEGIIHDSVRQTSGSRWSTEQVDIRLLNNKDFKVPAADPKFTAQLKKLLSGHLNEYGVVILDLTDMNNPRFAEHRGDYRQNVGSVGKLLVALGMFQAMADVWPEDSQRVEMLKNTLVTADKFSQSDHHTIRVFDLENKKLKRTKMRIGQQGSQYEFLDWMLSVSSNAAAAMNQRQAMLMNQYGQDFQPPEAEIKRYFKETPSKEKTALFQKTFWEPVTRNGMDLNKFRQGSFFTHGGKQMVNGGGNSYGTANEILKYLLTMEKGELVDEFSSRQLKRLLYLTERRIRYASSPALKNSAVYYKSGSLYKCKKEEGYKCKAYAGNVRNYMNSVAIIESSPEEGNLYYMVVVISNVLRKNSAVDHQTLGTRIHRLIQKAHPVKK